MIKLAISEPSEKQKMFLRARAKHVGYGGARGGGKSWAVRTKAKLLALNYPGIRMLIVRRTYPELINNHVRILKSELKSIAKYNDKDKILIFGNGSTINFTYCAKDKDLDRLQGLEFDVIFLDEATQLSEYQMQSITACMRGVNAFPKRIYYTCNPGGQGHGYIKRIFIDRKFREGENPEEYEFIQALVTDNTALMASQPDYIRQLDALPPKLRAAWRDGAWDVFQGQFFEEFVDNPKSYEERVGTHVIAPFTPPKRWKRFRSFDWGFAKPFSVGWWVMDEDGILYRILELYGCTDTPNEGVRWMPDKVFEEIHRIEQEHPYLKGQRIEGVADPAIWDASTGKSIADTAAEHKVYFTPGDHTRIPGWMQVHYRLAFDEHGIPMMYVFSTCKAFIRTMPLLVYSDTRPEDLDTSMEDHVADEVRYLCMSNPLPPRETEKHIRRQYDPLDLDKDDFGDGRDKYTFYRL